jgi:hypothetical protein
MNWSPSMSKKRDVFLKVCEEHPRFTTYFFDNRNIYGLGKKIYLSVYYIAPEEVHLLVKAAKKYYNLVVL